jgi:hypothetical protein
VLPLNSITSGKRAEGCLHRHPFSFLIEVWELCCRSNTAGGDARDTVFVLAHELVRPLLKVLFIELADLGNIERQRSWANLKHRTGIRQPTSQRIK